MNAPVKYENVQVIEHEDVQDQEQAQNGFRSFCKKAVVAVSSVAVSSYALALDISGELGKTTAKSDIETGIIWALGIAITIFAGRRVIGFFSR